MKLRFFFLTLLLSSCFQQAYANRSLYVDGFSPILGDVEAENNLLEYAQSNEIETLLLYELHLVNANYNLANPSTNYVLADFISKAKVTYGIVNMGATSENAESFTTVIDAYNNSRTNPNEKFDIYNLEFEFWNSESTDPGEIYCTSYLEPNGFPCTNAGAFQFFMSTLEIMGDLADNNSHPISVEAYVGWPSAEQAAIIGANLDKLLLHAYVSEATTTFEYSQNRLIDFANGNPGLTVSIIFSSEEVFMHGWLAENSMSEAESTFTEDFLSGSSSWPNTVNLEGFTYFNYSTNVDINLSSSNSEGCTDPAYLEFNPYAELDDSSCATLAVVGCMYEFANNYNPQANKDDLTCVFSENSCLGDFNLDGAVTTADLSFFLSAYGTLCAE